MFQPATVAHINSAYARPNLRIGPINIPITKNERHASAVSKRELNKTKYLECKAKAQAKGKGVYPIDPKGDCKSKYKSWQKWRGKAGERALKLAEQAERKGRLDPELATALQADMATGLAETSTAPISGYEDAPLDYATQPASSLPVIAVGGGVLLLGSGLLYLLFFRR